MLIFLHNSIAAAHLKVSGGEDLCKFAIEGANHFIVQKLPSSDLNVGCLVPLSRLLEYASILQSIATSCNTLAATKLLYSIDWITS